MVGSLAVSQDGLAQDGGPKGWVQMQCILICTGTSFMTNALQGAFNMDHFGITQLMIILHSLFRVIRL